MGKPIEELYFNWLYAKVCDPLAESKSQKFEVLIRELHKTEFVPQVPGDDNRAEDGCDLRDEFLDTVHEKADDVWMSYACSVLEALIALSRKAAYNTSSDIRTWFWRMLSNLGLAELSDDVNPNPNHIQQVLDVFVWRMYDHNGNGGVFPLTNTEYDQRYIELWYQLNEYIHQNHIV